MSKLKGICPLCQEEVKEGEKECRFRFGDDFYWVHTKCAHPKNEQLERIERMLKWLLINKVDKMWAEKYADKIDRMPTSELEDYLISGMTKRQEWLNKHLPDISDILKEEK